MSPVIPIYTIGYGQRSAEKLFTLLQQHDIAYLVDVRSTPFAAPRPEFDRSALTARAKSAGLRYLYLGNLLGERPDDRSCYNGADVDYATLARKAWFVEGIDRLEKAFRQQRVIVLFSSEAAPETSHRSKLLGKALAQRDIPVMHIDESDRLQPHAAIMRRLDAPPLPSPPPIEMDDWLPPPPPPPEFDEMPPPLFEMDAPPPAEMSAVAPVPTETGDVRDTLRRVFGYDSFRPNQARIIDNILAKKDTLVIMPTGGGKSLCYQLPALHMDGLTVVVSPLISLMQDQVTQLVALGVAATFLNSSLAQWEYQDRVRQIAGGQIKLLYMAPESLLRSDNLRLLNRANLACLTIDEAHCISSWGHDFRPEYRRLVEVRQRFPQAVCVALTATATPRVRADIQQSLRFEQDNQFVSSFDRPNLRLNVRPRDSALLQVAEFVNDRADQSGIIYCGTRKRVNEISSALTERGVNCLPYHGGMASNIRATNQDAFIRDDVPIIVATIAFGMGINKPNVRWVLHVDLPKNVESYYQEIGRAGRDGLPSDCLLLFNYQDVAMQRHFIQQGSADEYEGRDARLQALVTWAQSGKCRRIGLLGYFGEKVATERCDNCDNCLREPVAGVDITILAQKFLSAVLRVRERFGMSHIINVLRGSAAQSVTKWGHQSLSVYGIGQDISAKEWKHLARQFIAQDLVEQDGRYPRLKITASGRRVLKGEKVSGTRLPTKPQVREQPTEQLRYKTDLYNRLRAKRKQLADAANVPPYVVLPENSLVEMATYFPHSPAAFGRISGVGEKKLAQYADDFLPIVAAYCKAHNLTEHPHLLARRETVRKKRGMGGRTQEVADQYLAGATVAALQAQYDVKRQTIITHLAKAVKAGIKLSTDRLQAESELVVEAQEQVLLAFDELGDQALRPVFDHFSQQVSYDELHLLRAVYWLQNGVKSAEPASHAAEEKLFERLQKLTAQIAQRERVPPFMIFNTRTLRAIVTHMPRTIDALAQVEGVGRQRARQYGERYVALIASAAA